MAHKRNALICAGALGAAMVLLCGTVGVVHHQENKITFPVADTLPDGGGKKATVILLGGQSNASGCSLDAYLQKNVSAEKYAEYQNGYDNVYINYLRKKIDNVLGLKLIYTVRNQGYMMK